MKTSITDQTRNNYSRRLRNVLGVGLTILTLGFTNTGQAMPNAQDTPAIKQDLLRKGAFFTTVDYVAHFYPLWFTYYQFQVTGDHNRLIGPVRISPLYHIVVAINDDTLYASMFLNLTAQPVILTIPPTTATYSILSLNPYGEILPYDIPKTNGTYALTGPDWTGTLPSEVTPIQVPLNISVLIFRVDKYSTNGEDERAAAELFRRSLATEPLCAYLNQSCDTNVPSGGPARIAPEAFFSVPFKTIADSLITKEPITFLKTLQKAVNSPNTPPMSPEEQAVSQAFDNLFGNGDFSHQRVKKAEFSAGARAAHALIVDSYLSHQGPTGWINFTNIGDWGDHYIQRSAITEFLQFGNGHSTAAYYHAFVDGQGRALDGSNPHGYVLTFPANQIPAAKRFWSLTAYTPQAIELVPNPANKYLVASYTPGLQTNRDGSISIYMATTLPKDVPAANWLPIPRGHFNVMLRVYGPEGSVTNATYIPPSIVRGKGVHSDPRRAKPWRNPPWRNP